MTSQLMALRYVFVLKFVLGLGFALALPPLSQVWLIFLCLSLLLILDSRRPPEKLRHAFWGGFALGLGYFSFALHWIGYAFLVDTEAYLWMMPFAVGGLAAFMAVYWGCAFLAAEWMTRRGIQRWLSFPIMLALVEWLRGYLFTGFPWDAPGLMADGMGGVLQLASLVGMPGLTLLVFLWGVLPAAIFLSGRKSVTVVLLLLTLPASWWWGEQRLATHPPDAERGPLMRLVQPNIAQSDKWRSENSGKIFDDLMTMTSAAPKSGAAPTVIIWPEASVPFLLDESETALRRIADSLAQGQILISGAIRRQPSDTGQDFFTSILTINDQGTVVNRYDKWRLVPGGEYLPLAWLLEPLGFRKVANLPEAFTPGPGPAQFDIPGVGAAVMLICYEAVFPHNLVSEGKRARWIVNVTNDGWFGHSIGPYQHLAQTRMRAVEQGLPVARAANTGVSAVIDALGRYLATTELETAAFVDARLPESLPPTLFARAGAAPFLILSVLLILLAGYRRSKI